MSSLMNNSLLYQYRVIVIGDSNVGKSSLVRSFIKSRFKEKCHPTIGVNFYVALIALSAEIHVKLQIWDTAGQERYRSIIRSYYRNCAGCFIVYDITKRESFEHIDSWLDEAQDSLDNENIIYFLVGHKLDLNRFREVSTSDGEEYAKAHDMIFLETSAKIPCNVDELFIMMAKEICRIRLSCDITRKSLINEKAVILSSQEDLLASDEWSNQRRGCCKS